MSIASSLDKRMSMQDMLTKAKILNDLAKGTASMKHIYPTVLQSAAIPLLKKEKKCVLLKYCEYAGIKLTVLLPLLDKQIRYSVK